jgi:isopenicillin-N epimerase
MPLPAGALPEPGQRDPLAIALYDNHQIEVPIVHWPAAGRRWIRISAMVYNERSDYERLADALATELELAVR